MVEVFVLADVGRVIYIVSDDAAAVEVRPCHWYPEFGVAVANRCIVARFAGNTLATYMEWN